MELTETDEGWLFTYFPDIPTAYTKDEWKEHGYRITIGTITQHDSTEFVPKSIEYAKSRFSMEEAINYAKNIKTCPLCKGLNAQIDLLTKIKLKDQMNPDAVKVNVKEPEEKKKKPSSMFKDMFTTVFIDALFTRPGMFLIGSLLDDEGLMSLALPAEINDEQMREFIAELCDFFAGDIGLIRSPSELRSYSKSLRREQQPPQKQNNNDEMLKNIASLFVISNL